MAYSTRCCHAYDLQRALLPCPRPIACTAARPTSCGAGCCRVYGLQHTLLPKHTADIICLYHAYDLTHVLLLGLWPIASTAAMPMAYSVHCFQAYGLSGTPLPGVWPVAYPAARRTAHSVHCCPADGLPCSNLLRNSLLSGDRLCRSLLYLVLLS